MRNAVAAGITVVVAAGNYGLDADGRELYGTISSPGNEPSAITVGSANPHGTDSARRRHRQLSSARAARRAAAGLDANGVAPSRQRPEARPRRAGQPRHRRARHRHASASYAATLLPSPIPQLVVQARPSDTGLMVASGTSFSAPVVSGTVALHAAGQPRPHAAARQGDPAVHRRAAAGLQPARSRARAW